MATEGRDMDRNVSQHRDENDDDRDTDRQHVDEAVFADTDLNPNAEDQADAHAG